MLMFCIIFVLLNEMAAGRSVTEHAAIVENDPAFHIKFPKSMSLPEKLSLIPPGHFKEFGMQNPPVGQIPEYFNAPTPKELWDAHVKLYRPAVYRDLLRGSPALDLWTDDEYLLKEYGDQDVLVEKKLEDRKSETKRMTLEGFLQQYKVNNWYVVTILPNAMRKEVRVPKPLMCSTFKENLQELNLWIGTHGTRSMIHYDADNILHCVVAGRKDWMLINPKDASKLDMVIGQRSSGSGFSLLDPDSIDLTTNPEVADIAWEYATLYAGDCLYLPPQYLHQVRSYNRSVSATYLFYPRDKFNDTDCANVDLDSYQKLSDIYVYWTYEKGQETVDFGYENPFDVKKSHVSLHKAAGVTPLVWKEYLYISTIASSEQLSESVHWLRSLFEALDTNDDQQVSFEEIEKGDMEAWKRFCRSRESSSGPTSSEMNNDPGKTNASAAFNPREHDYYDDIKKAKRFLNRLIKEEGVNKTLTYHKFVNSVEIVHSDQASAFVLIDANMDGSLSSSEVIQASDPALRRFCKMGYINRNNRELSGGGLYMGETVFGEENDEEEDELMEQCDFVPKVLGRGLEWVQNSREKRMDLDQFKQLLDDVPDSDAKRMLDLKFLFRLVGQSREYLTVEDFNEVLRESDDDDLEKSSDDDEDTPVVKKDRSVTEVWTRNGVVFGLCPAMAMLREVEAREARRKSPSTKDEL